MLRVSSASTALTRAHYRYDFAPARHPCARPEPAQPPLCARAMTRILTIEVGTYSLVSKSKWGNKGVPLEVPHNTLTKHLCRIRGFLHLLSLIRCG
eukprot:scaffold10356_cov118-Isochrysis_galbana.AAC.3